MKLRCLLGHRWRILCNSYKSIILAHCHSMAGSLAYCERCFKVWDDLPDYLTPERRSPEQKELVERLYRQIEKARAGKPTQEETPDDRG